MATIEVGADKAFTSLQEAINVASNIDTIVLTENVTETSISIDGKDIVIDLGGFTFTGKTYIKNGANVFIRNGKMTVAGNSPAFDDAVIKVTDGEVKVDGVTTVIPSSLNLDRVEVDGGEAINSRYYTHAVKYDATGGLTITDCTITAGTATRNAECTISGNNTSSAIAIYAPNKSGGKIEITNSTINGGDGYTDIESYTKGTGFLSPGGYGISLHGKSEVIITDSTITGGDSNWFNAAAAVNVSNQFSGTLSVIESTVTGGTAQGKGSATSGIGGAGIYTNMSTGCKEIDITGSVITGGDGGNSWNGSGIEYRNGNIEMTITDSAIESGNGANASGSNNSSDPAGAGALLIANSQSTKIVLDEVKLNGAGDNNTVVKGGGVGITLAGPVEITGGTLDNTNINVDAEGFEGTEEVISGATGSDVEVSVSGNDDAVVIVEGGKTYVTTETDPTDADTSVVYVNNNWDGKEANAMVGVGKYLGVNAFASSKDALTAANAEGGEVTINVTGMGDDNDEGASNNGGSLIQLTNPGTYTITGGDGASSKLYGITFSDGVNVVFDQAFLASGKLGDGASGSLTVKDSVVGSLGDEAFAGAQGWFTYKNTAVKIENSIFGMRSSDFGDAALELPRSAEEVKAAIAAGTYTHPAYGQNHSGANFGTLGTVDVDDSTMYTGYLSVVDRALMTVDNSVLYYGGTFSIGAGEVTGYTNNAYYGWDVQHSDLSWVKPPHASAEGYREGLAAQVDITDSILYNIGYGDGSATHGGTALQVGGYFNNQDYKGILNITRSEVNLGEGDADAVHSILDITANGTVNMTDSTLVAEKVVNAGAFTVTGESTMKIDNLTGNGIILDDATLSADSNIGGSAATKVYGTSVIKGTVGTVHANWTGVKENGSYIGYTTDKVALTLDGATTGNVYVGSDTEGYGAELTVSGGSTVGGIYCRVYGSANITGSDNVINYINAKGSITVKDAENTKIEAMVAEGGTVNIIDSDIDIAIGTNNNIQLDEGTTMEISGSTVDIQQLSIDETSALNLTNSTLTVDDVYDEVNTITNNGSITIDATSTLTADVITMGEKATITIDADGFSGTKKVIDLAGTSSLEGKVTVKGEGITAIYGADGDVTITDASAETVYFNYNWAGEVAGTEIAAGKVIGVNAFAEFTDNGTNDKGWSNLLVLPEGTTEVVLTAGNENASYGMLRPTQSITVKTEGEDYAVIDRFVNMGCDLTFAEGSKVKVIGSNVGLSGANNQGGTVTINGEVYMAIAPNNGNKALYLCGMNGTPGELVINAGGILKADCANVENHGTITVYGTMELGKLGDAPKLAGVGANNGGWHGHLIVDGKDGEGIVSVAHNQLNFGGGNTSVDWQEPAGDCSVDIINGGKITTAAVSFRNGAKNTLTINNGTLEFTNDPDYDNLTPRYFDNQGIINVTNGTLDMSGRNFDNTGSITVSGASDIKAAVSGSGWVYMNSVDLDKDTQITGANIRFASGNNVIDGATINNKDNVGVFQVGSIDQEDANVDFKKPITVTVKNSTIASGTAKDCCYVGVGNTLAIENSLAYFKQVNSYGDLSITGDTAGEKHTWSRNAEGLKDIEYSTYVGTFNVFGGKATLKNTSFHAFNNNIYSQLTVDGSTAYFTGQAAMNVGLRVQADGIVSVKNASTVYANNFENKGTITLDGENTKMILTGSKTHENLKNVEILNNASLTDNGSVSAELNNSGSITVSGGLVDVDSIVNNGKVTISKTSSWDAVITGNAAEVAAKAVINGALTADLALKGNITLNADYTGVISGKKVVTITEDKVVKIADGSEISALVVGNGVEFTAEESINGVEIKGASKDAVITIADTVLNGNKFSNGKLVVTGVNDDLVEVNTELANIASINGFAVENAAGFYYYVDGDVTKVLSKTAEGIEIGDSTSGDAAIDNVGNQTFKEDSDALAEVNVEMAKGNTTIKVANGKAVKNGGIDLMEFAIGSVTKNENGGKNNFSFGNYSDVDVNGNIEALGSLTVGKNSFIDVNGTVSGNNTAQKLSIGVGSTANFKKLNFDTNLNAADKDSFSVSAGAEVITGEISGLDTLNIASGKSVAYTEMTINGDYTAPAANNSITLGNYAELTVNGSIDNGSDTSTGTTIKAGNFSSIDVDGDVNGLAGLTLGKESTFNTGSINGTEKANKINLGAGAKAKVDAAIDLKDGKNSITLGKGAWLKADSIRNAMTINGGAEAELTVNGAIDSVQKLTIGKGGWLYAQSISGTEGNDTFNFANESVIGSENQAIDLDFGAGNDTVKIGNNATAFFADTNFGEGKNTLSIGNGSEVEFADTTFGTGNDTVKIGNDSIVKFGKLNMGDADKDKDTLTIGKNAKVYVDALDGVETLNAAKGAEIWFSGDVADLTDVKGNWKDATIYDMEGELLNANTYTGIINYANEWDVYNFSNDTNGNGTLKLTGADVEFQYSLNGTDWYIADTIAYSADSDLMIRVKKTDETKDYSFTAELA